jgi:hypothetical protein
MPAMIPGILIGILTFPGVIVHEFAHVLMCRMTATPVRAVKYFQIASPLGYVLHDQPSSIWKQLLIGVGPVFVNTVAGFLLGAIALAAGILGLPLMWLAVSVAKHAFPSTGDARSLWQALRQKDVPLPAKFIGIPLVAAIYAGAFASVFWVDFIYAFFIALILPRGL